MDERNDDLLFVYRDDRNDSTMNAIVATVLIAPHLSGPKYPPPLSIYVMSDNPFPMKWQYYVESRHMRYGLSVDDSYLVQRAIQNEKQIDLLPYQPVPPTPFYLSGNREKKPTTYTVIVRFVFDTVDFLPSALNALAREGWIASPSEEDLASALKKREPLIQSWKEQRAREDAQRGWFHRLWHAASEQRKADYDYYKNFLALAHSTEPFPGLYLPVFLNGIEPPGVLQIIEAQGQRTFSATLYLSDKLGDVQMPIELVSQDRRRQGDQFHVVAKVIGSIVEIVPRHR